MNPLLITIRSHEDGYYRWELHEGPDGAFSYSGRAPLLERCFEDIIRSQWVLAEHLTSDLHTESIGCANDSPHPAPIPEVHTASGTALPAQQDIPATRHSLEASSSIYPLPSKSG